MLNLYLKDHNASFSTKKSVFMFLPFIKKPNKIYWFLGDKRSIENKLNKIKTGA